MEEVGITEGLKYGFRIMGYYLGVAVVGAVLAVVGIGMSLFEGLKAVLGVAVALLPQSAAGAVPAGVAGSGPNVGFILFGLIIVVAGVLLVLAGLFGSLYKLIADAVAEGRRLSELEPPADDETDAADGPADEAAAAADQADTETESSDGDGDTDDADTDGPDDESDTTAD
jgi:hypothetical protein